MRTRIIATVGPACAQPNTLKALIKEGVTVFRFNFSHGTMEDHERMLHRIRSITKNHTKHVSILQDLAGHRIRTGHLTGGHAVMLEERQRFALYRSLVAG